jgi:hypothetical protein
VDMRRSLLILVRLSSPSFIDQSISVGTVDPLRNLPYVKVSLMRVDAVESLHCSFRPQYRLFISKEMACILRVMLSAQSVIVIFTPHWIG